MRVSPPHRRLIVFTVAAFLLLAVLACSPLSGATSGGSGNLTLVNNSGTTVCYVYISPTSDTTWGDDWLGSSETISNGSSRSFTVTPGDYDLRADDCNHNVLDDTRGVRIGSSSTTWTIR